MSQAPLRSPSKPIVSLPAAPPPGTPPPHKRRGYGGDNASFDLHPEAAAPLLRHTSNIMSTPASLLHASRTIAAAAAAASSAAAGPLTGTPAALAAHHHGGEDYPSALADESNISDYKIILDRVHEHVALPRIALDIMDTPEFQRLRGLKQLGFTSWLYPAATHTRFEHSIGVAHLANTMVKRIARRQPELGVTEADVQVVTVAGLCHDIGHGPFSHLFEVIVNKVRGERGQPDFHHESMSVRLLSRVLDRLDLASYGLDQRDAFMMKLCIEGLKPGAPWPAEATGRDAWKRFLVEIVSNKRNGIDVDKLDYFMRDSMCCYGRATVDCHIPRLISACRVLRHNNEYQLCFEEKLAQPLGDIFTLRAKMHKYAYQHRIIRVIDHMVTDILGLADPFLKVRGAGGALLRISECVEDEEGYIKLGDWIMSAIDASPEEGMRPAQALVDRLNRRDFYAVAGHGTMAEYLDTVNKAEVRDALMAILHREVAENGGTLAGPFFSGDDGVKSPANVSQQPSFSTLANPESMLSLSAADAQARPTAAISSLLLSPTPTAAADGSAPASPLLGGAVDSSAFSAEAKAFLREAAETLIVDFVKIHYGSSDSEGNPDDPINHVTFFNPKRSLTVGFNLPRDRQSPLFSPMRFGEKSIVLIVRNRKYVRPFARAFEEWKGINRSRFISAVPVYNFSPSKTAVKRQREPPTDSQLSDGWAN